VRTAGVEESALMMMMMMGMIFVIDWKYASSEVVVAVIVVGKLDNVIVVDIVAAVKLDYAADDELDIEVVKLAAVVDEVYKVKRLIGAS
jgi:hypothetical protein